MSQVVDALPRDHAIVSTTNPPRLDKLLRDRVLGALERLGSVRFSVRDPIGIREVGAGTSSPIRIEIRDPSVYRTIALRGSIGAAEAYIDGLVDCDDLVGMLRGFAREDTGADLLEQGVVRLANAAESVRHAFRRNTRRGSRANIAAHYDLGNELFGLFLDETRMYSSAIYARDDESLEEAQQRRLDRIGTKLALSPSDHVVEIGTGWGGLALHLATRFGCRVTTTTISKEQHAYAVESVSRAGLSDRITVLLEDYRDLHGRYDRLVSIEMVEAVGADFLDTFTRTCTGLLHRDGMALLQAITIEDHRYEQARGSVDFIKRHVFPGCAIPSVSVLTSSFARTGDARLLHLEDFGPSYARTLAEWRRRFESRREDVLALGYDERFLRYWSYYLAYCEAGFAERRLGVAQLVLARPDARPALDVPALPRLG